MTPEEHHVPIHPIVGTLSGPDYLTMATSPNHAWLHHHTPLPGSLFVFGRVLKAEGLDDIPDGERIYINGHVLYWRDGYRELVKEGRLWVNRHNDAGYPFAFVVAEGAL